jgi:hypothetical protein
LKVGGSIASIGAAAIRRAEAALKGLSVSFAEWLEEEVVGLEQAAQGLAAKPGSIDALEYLYMRSHDLKGLGATYGYPLVTRIAASLCKLVDDEERRVDAPAYLIQAHVSAVRAAVRDRIRAVDHPIGLALVQELEGKVAARGGA